MIPARAVEAATRKLADLNSDSGDQLTDEEWARAILEAAAPHILADKVAEAKANNDHIIEGGNGYSAGFHYALHCIDGSTDDR